MGCKQSWTISIEKHQTMFCELYSEHLIHICTVSQMKEQWSVKNFPSLPLCWLTVAPLGSPITVSLHQVEVALQSEELRSRDNPVTLNPKTPCSNMSKCEKILVYSVLL